MSERKTLIERDPARVEAALDELDTLVGVSIPNGLHATPLEELHRIADLANVVVRAARADLLIVNRPTQPPIAE